MDPGLNTQQSTHPHKFFSHPTTQPPTRNQYLYIQSDMLEMVQRIGQSPEIYALDLKDNRGRGA